MTCARCEHAMPVSEAVTLCPRCGSPRRHARGAQARPPCALGARLPGHHRRPLESGTADSALGGSIYDPTDPIGQDVLLALFAQFEVTCCGREPVRAWPWRRLRVSSPNSRPPDAPGEVARGKGAQHCRVVLRLPSDGVSGAGARRPRHGRLRGISRMTEPAGADPQAADWGGLSWSEWYDFD
jgi:hypothetical protein